MSVNLGLLVVVAILAACGSYLLMERSLIRMLLGLLLVGNAINLLIITLAGPPGNPPILGRTSDHRTHDADPLAQAMVLTAIVITMGVGAFILAMVYRLFVLNRDDDNVEDDVEDRKVLHTSLKNAPDRDRSDNPETGADTPLGDLFDDEGNPLTPEEYAALHRTKIETDLMPEDDDVVDEVSREEDELATEVAREVDELADAGVEVVDMTWPLGNDLQDPDKPYPGTADPRKPSPGPGRDDDAGPPTEQGDDR